MYHLSSRRFEELIADVFQQYGFRTVLTGRTPDKGADVVLLHNDSNDAAAIVECKRYAAARPVGISYVRHLVGAAVDWEVRRAYLVTSSTFTDGARNKGRILGAVVSKLI